MCPEDTYSNPYAEFDALDAANYALSRLGALRKPEPDRLTHGDSDPDPLAVDDFDSWTDDQRIAYSRAVSNTFDPAYLNFWTDPERKPVFDTYVIRPLTESDLDYKRITDRYFDAYPRLRGFGSDWT